MEKKKILVVEDERIIGEELKIRLKNIGYDVPLVVSSGEKAVKEVEKLKPDLILMDIILQGKLDGIETIKLIKNNFDIPFIFLTSHSDEKTLEKAKLLEPSGYLIKPINERELHSTVQMALYKYDIEIKLKRSEEKYRGIFENFQDIYFEADIDGKLLEISPSVEEITKYNRNDIIGQEITQFYVNLDDRKELRKDLFKKGKIFGHEVLLQDRDGTPIIFSMNAKLFKDDKGTKIIGSMRDITEHKKMVKQIQEQSEKLEKIVKERTIDLEKEKEKYKSLFEKSNDPIFILDTKTYEIIDCNLQVKTLFGNLKKECSNKKFYEVFINEDKNIIIKNLKNVIKEKSINFISMGLSDSKNNLIFLETNLTLIEFGNQKIIQAICKDVSQIKQFEEGLMNKTLNFEIVSGNTYLVEEPIADKSLDIFNNLIECGLNGFIFSRNMPSFFKKNVSKTVNIYWLAEKKIDKMTISPLISNIEEKIESFKRGNNVVFLDRFDYLLNNNSFKEVLKFLQRLVEFIYLQKWILIISLDPRTINKKELNLLKKETMDVNPKQKIELEKNIHTILQFINKENKTGKLPSVNDIANSFKISRDTARKRINILILRDLIKINKTGRLKLIEITEKGKENL